VSNLTLGVDLGQTSDFTAVIVAERVQMMQPIYDNVIVTYKAIDVFHIGTLYRWPLNTAYFQDRERRQGNPVRQRPP